MAEDRRVRKTKKAIQDVFCEMTKEKKLNEITVKELCLLTEKILQVSFGLLL